MKSDSTSVVDGMDIGKYFADKTENTINKNEKSRNEGICFGKNESISTKITTMRESENNN